ncbi:phosphohistidine phosphatase SixA [soil metagenome]
MKTLYLLRHAKSSWEDSTLSDFERPLNERGQKTAPFMGELMARLGFDPYVILSSPAARTRETASLIKKAGKFDAEIMCEHRIYEASPKTLRQVLSELNDAYQSVLLIGHNPGIEGFIRLLTGEVESMPTAALAVIEINTDNWDLVDEGRGTLQQIYRPKEQMQSPKV